MRLRKNLITTSTYRKIGVIHVRSQMFDYFCNAIIISIIISY